MSIFSEVYNVFPADQVSQRKPKIFRLSRQAAQEVLLAAVLCPLFCTDLSATFQPKTYATDSSDAKGAVVSRSLDQQTMRVLWRTRRSKTCYSRMLSREEAVVRKLDWMYEEIEDPGSLQEVPHPERPHAFRYHFIEVCGGAGKISRCLADRGWVVGPVIDLDRSPHFDFAHLRVLQWLFYLIEAGLLDSFMVEPPCTTFSPAQHPASRGYDCPRGFDPLEEKTLLGTALVLRALSLMALAADLCVPGLLEQPRRSKEKAG